MTSKEKKIRMLWLYSYVVSLLLGNLISYVFQRQQIPILVLLLSSLFGILFCWLVLFCAYYKPGTKLLTFFIWATPISLVSSFLIRLLSNIPIGVEELVVLPINLFWAGLCFPMRTINRKLQDSVKELAS